MQGVWTVGGTDVEDAGRDLQLGLSQAAKCPPRSSVL